VDVERVFSRAGRLVTRERNGLSAQSIRALMCVGYWSLMGMVQDKDLLKIAKDGKAKPSDSEKDLVDIDLPAAFDVIDIADDEEDTNADVE
jgi:hypothetical protein